MTKINGIEITPIWGCNEKCPQFIKDDGLCKATKIETWQGQPCHPMIVSDEFGLIDNPIGDWKVGDRAINQKGLTYQIEFIGPLKTKHEILSSDKGPESIRVEGVEYSFGVGRILDDTEILVFLCRAPYGPRVVMRYDEFCKNHEKVNAL